MKTSPAVFCTLCIASAAAWGDTVTLRNGTQLPGQVIPENGAIVLRVAGSETRLEAGEIARIHFSGPGSLRAQADALDAENHVRYDAWHPDRRELTPGASRIEARLQEMLRAGINPGPPMAAERTCARGRGQYRVYRNSTFYSNPETGTHEVHGAIRDYYVLLGAESGRLGYPVSDEQPDGSGRTSTFEHGTVSWNAATGVAVEFAR